MLVFSARDLLKPDSSSARALVRICEDVIPSFPSETVELVVLHPFVERVFEWTDLPGSVKDFAEMRLHGPVDETLYDVYGIGLDTGAVVTVRPDGYVGFISSLTDVMQVDTYLSSCLVRGTENRPS